MFTQISIDVPRGTSILILLSKRIVFCDGKMNRLQNRRGATNIQYTNQRAPTSITFLLSKRSFMRFCLIAFMAISAPCFAQDPPIPKVPPGFKVELVLQAPDIEAPTALAVAPNGDVYYAEDPMDMSGPPTQNIDKIWMLKGGDPKKKVLIADKMWAVMGLEIVRDTLFVVHPPHVTKIFLDKEGSATFREDLFTDLGPKVAGVPSFNDHVPSGIHMGMDGWLYVSIGDKGIPKMTRKEKDQGSVHVAEGRWRHSKEGNHISLEGGGVIRFRPDGSGLEVFASGTRNHLDVPMDEHDRIFVRDNTDDGLGWNTRLHVSAAWWVYGLSVGVQASPQRDASRHSRFRRRLALWRLRLSR